jgi:hypothetical protein
MDGHIYYHNYSTGVNAKRPVRGGVVDAVCYGRSQPWIIVFDLVTPVLAGVNQSGYFSVTCPDDRYSVVDGSYVMDGDYVKVRGENNAQAGVAFIEYTGVTIDSLFVVNDPAAHVFPRLERYAGIAATRFSGFTRPKIKVYVSLGTDDDYGPRYCINSNGACDGADVIQTRIGRVWNETGLFSIVHEYGHAFHYQAIEPWASYSCTDDEHDVDEVDNHSCAFVEGFADFFGVWIAGDSLTNGFGGASLDDYTAEDNPFKTIASPNGARVEGAVAGFFYDLVDTGSSPHSVNNTTAADDDSVSWSGPYVAQLIKHCTLTGGPGATQLDAINQFIYCAEQSLAAQSLSNPDTGNPYFTSTGLPGGYTGISEGATEPSCCPAHNSSIVRVLWRWNLYGH